MSVVDSDAAEAMLEAMAEVTPLVAAATKGETRDERLIWIGGVMDSGLTGSTKGGLEAQGGLLVGSGAAGCETGLLEEDCQ
jgi:hypothetical protein